VDDYITKNKTKKILAKRKLSFSNIRRNKNPSLPTYQSSANLGSSLTKKKIKTYPEENVFWVGFSLKQQASNNGPKNLYLDRQKWQ
jgi:hypothetical protein